METLRAALYVLALLWINAYVCRDMFFRSTTYMGSMHGFWTALAARARNSWFHAAWWPFWDNGIPEQQARGGDRMWGRPSPDCPRRHWSFTTHTTDTTVAAGPAHTADTTDATVDVIPIEAVRRLFVCL
jgi:hypothetical protein